MQPHDIHDVVETVYRDERARLIAGLARLLRDVDLAQELAHDALVAALGEWPQSGIPAKPGAWLMTTARRRAIDVIRRRRMLERKHAEIGRAGETDGGAEMAAIEAAMDDDIGDERLGLIFTACHPLLAPEARAALTLRLIGGLTTAEIARAFLVSESTMGQRITRAKRNLSAAAMAFEIPQGRERDQRLSSVLEVIYLIFNEGYAATAGDDLMRPALCEEAIRLGRILTQLAPEEAEAHGLLALMEIQASRMAARTTPDGALVPLPAQDRSRWDRPRIRRGLEALARAEALGGKAYRLQAAIAAGHARAARYEDTDWRLMAGHYDRLLDVMPSPVVALNRAIAHSMAVGPEAGLALLAEIEEAPVLAGFAPLKAAKGDFLLRAGRTAEARLAFVEAAALSQNHAEKAFLLKRADDCLAAGS